MYGDRPNRWSDDLRGMRALALHHQLPDAAALLPRRRHAGAEVQGQGRGRAAGRLAVVPRPAAALARPAHRLRSLVGAGLSRRRRRAEHRHRLRVGREAVRGPARSQRRARLRAVQLVRAQSATASSRRSVAISSGFSCASSGFGSATSASTSSCGWPDRQLMRRACVSSLTMRTASFGNTLRRSSSISSQSPGSRFDGAATQRDALPLRRKRRERCRGPRSRHALAPRARACSCSCRAPRSLPASLRPVR